MLHLVVFSLFMRSSVRVEYVVECQILFSALNAAWAFHIRALMSTSVPFVLSILLPRYTNCASLSKISFYIQKGSYFVRAICISLVFFTLICIREDKKNQLDVTFCILYFSSNSCSTCFGQPCAHHQELTTA